MINWTPCSESQPTRPDIYLVTFEPLISHDKYDKSKVTVCPYYKEGKEMKWAKAKYGRVTAWAELPKAYEGDTNEEPGTLETR